MLEIFFHLEHIMGEPIGLRRGQGMQIDYGLQMWTTFQVYIKILTYFDPKSAQMRAQNDRLMREKKFSLGTHHGQANRPCEGDGVCE